MPIAAEYFVGFVNDEPVCHISITPKFEIKYYRATRLVVMPEWQGAGVGTRFLNWVCEYHKRGFGRRGHKLPTLFHTSHPQLIGYLKNSSQWVLKSQVLYGVNKLKSKNSILKTTKSTERRGGSTGYGGHFRSVQGFKYIGDGKAPKSGIPEY